MSIAESETGRKVDFNKLDSDLQKLIKESISARDNAYCPYSNFRVGAALQTESGVVYTGVNVENVSYGVGICAERSALCSAISAGDRNLKRIAVCADSDKGPVSPCGACREFIAEFSKKKDIVVYLTDSKLNHVLETSIRQLLPLTFIGFKGIR